MLVGDVLLVSIPTIINDAILYSLVLIFHFIFRKKFLAISIDADSAQSSGINIRVSARDARPTIGLPNTRRSKAAQKCQLISVTSEMLEAVLMNRRMPEEGWLPGVAP
jgi:hypothetical protein